MTPPFARDQQVFVVVRDLAGCELSRSPATVLAISRFGQVVLDDGEAYHLSPRGTWTRQHRKGEPHTRIQEIEAATQEIES